MEKKFSVVAVEPMVASLEELTKVLSKSAQLQVVFPKNVTEATQAIPQHLPCILLISNRSQSELEGQIALLKSIEKHTASGQVKVLVVASQKSRITAKIFATAGVTNYVEEPVQMRQLAFKINIAIKALAAAQKKMQSAALSENRTIIKSSEKEKEGEAQTLKGDGQSKFKPALQIGSDIFIFKTSKPRKIGRKYQVDVEGPSPVLGEWRKEPKPKDSREEDKWRWVPKKGVPGGEKLEMKGSDGWISHGDEPSYNPLTNKWQLRAVSPQLYLRKNRKTEAVKLETDAEGRMTLAEDSQTAKDNIDLSRKLAIQELGKDSKARSALKAQELAAKAELEKKDENGEEEQGGGAAGAIGANKNGEGHGGTVAGEGEKEAGEAVNGSGGESANSKLKEGAKGTAEAVKGKDGVAPENLTSKELEHQHQEEQLEGLAKEDLESDANTRDVRGRDIQGKVKDDHDPTGLNKDQLDSEANRRAGEKGQAKGQIRNEAEEEKAKQERPEAAGEAPKEAEDESASAAKKAEKQAQKKGLLPQSVKEKAIRRLAKVRTDIKKEKTKPIPKKLEPAAESALRKQLGITNRPEVKGRALANMAKADKLKKLKQEERKIKNFLRRKGVPASEIEEKEEEARLELRKKEKAKRNFRALDAMSGEEEPDEAELEGAAKPEWQDDEASDPDAEEDSRLTYLLPLDQVLPLEASWETDSEHWFFLAKSVYSKPPKAVGELLPMWVYNGEDSPDILKEENSWRFFDVAPRRVETVPDLPKGVREMLADLCEAEEEKPEAEAEEAEKPAPSAEPGESEEPKKADTGKDSKEAAEKQAEAGGEKKKKEKDATSSEEPGVPEQEAKLDVPQPAEEKSASGAEAKKKGPRSVGEAGNFAWLSNEKEKEARKAERKKEEEAPAKEKEPDPRVDLAELLKKAPEPGEMASLKKEEAKARDRAPTAEMPAPEEPAAAAPTKKERVAAEVGRMKQKMEKLNLDPKLKGEIEAFLENGELLEGLEAEGEDAKKGAAETEAGAESAAEKKRQEGAALGNEPAGMATAGELVGKPGAAGGTPAPETAAAAAGQGELYVNNPFFQQTDKLQFATAFLLADVWADQRPFEHYAKQLTKLARQVSHADWISVVESTGSDEGIAVCSTFPKLKSGEKCSIPLEETARSFPCKAASLLPFGGKVLGFLVLHGKKVELTKEQEKMLLELATAFARFWGQYKAQLLQKAEKGAKAA